MKTSNKAPKAQTIESLQLSALKVSHRYQLLLVAFAFTVLGIIGGYFLSVSIITETQAKAVSVFSSAASKE